ncbi:MAG TPA: HEPN domain-containing protein [Solirubrobacterales bacterium]|nr:HEPN domain-containing protein [Solirubrobacterales bacterium]
MLLPWTATQLIGEVDGIFERAETQIDMEVQSDYAKYLVIRLSGLVEQVVTEVVLAHVSAQSSTTVLGYVTAQVRRFRNPNFERVEALVGSFDRRWSEELSKTATRSEREALGSVRAQRNRIAHGQQSTVSLVQAKGYFTEIKSLLDRIARHF